MIELYQSFVYFCLILYYLLQICMVMVTLVFCISFKSHIVSIFHSIAFLKNHFFPNLKLSILYWGIGGASDKEPTF